MSNADTNRVIDRIRKLMSLAENNTNPHQAEASMAKAYELMVKNNLSQDAILGNQPFSAKDYVKLKSEVFAKLPVEAPFIYPILEEFFNVTIVYYSQRNNSYVSFIGKPENCEIAEFIFDQLLVTYKSLWDIFKGRTNAPVKAKKAFYVGVEKGLNNKLRAEKQSIEQEMGLVIIKDPNLKDAVASLCGKLGKAGVIRYNAFDAATGAGMQAGSTINVKHGIGSGSTDKRMLLG